MFFRLFANRALQIVLLLLLLAAALQVQVTNPAPLQRLRNMAFDYYNKVLPREAGDDVVIVDIDEESLQRLGQWPWPRKLMGDLPVALKALGAKATAFDMAFAEPDRTSPAAIARALPATKEMAPVAAALQALPDNDAIFAEKIAAAGNVVTGFVSANQKTLAPPVMKAGCLRRKKEGSPANPLRFIPAHPDFAVSLLVLSAAAAGNGSFTTQPEDDGVMRSVPLFVGYGAEGTKPTDIFPALSLEALRIATDPAACYTINSVADGIWGVRLGALEMPTDEEGRLRVYYAGHRDKIYVSAWKVLAHQVPEERIRGKIALIGTSSIGLLDLRSSPLNPVLPGVEIHAEIIEQILHHQFISRSADMARAEVMVTGAISLLVIFLAPFIGTGIFALLAAALIGSSILGGFYLFEMKGDLLDPYYPALVITTIFILSSILSNLRSDVEKRAVRQAFGQYISPVLMEELAAHPEKLQLGGEVRELSVMFTDIRNFTSIAEGMPPAELIRLMNDFLTPMTSAVLDNRGTVDKYMGDAMMAFWNAPLPDDAHAAHACTAALQMMQGLEALNERLAASAAVSGKVFAPLKAGIGIHSGMASVGNMGSRQRFAYSALGDTVNLASRIEGQTKTYGVPTLISAATKNAAPGFAVIEVDLLAVKGRAEPERIYALLGDNAMAEGDDFKSFAAAHAAMLAAYRAQNWEGAEKQAEACSAAQPALDGLYRLYRQRIAAYRLQPPPAGWTGVWVAQEK